MNKRSTFFKLVALLLCTTFLYSCNNSSTSQNINSSIDEDQVNQTNLDDENISSLISEIITYDTNDFYTDWKNENPSYIKLNGTDVNIEGTGAKAEGGEITITDKGVYVISGELDNGQVIVDVKDEDIVRIILNGVEINCIDNAPIYVKNAEKVIITLQEGTKNYIADGEEYNFVDSSMDEPNSAIFSKGDITINGTGELVVNGNYNNGITSKDNLIIMSGNINIYAADDGLMGKDLVLIKEGNISIESGGDGIKSTNDSNSSKGNIAIEGANIEIKSDTDGIQAENIVLITGGSYMISSGGGSSNSSNKINEDKRQKPTENMESNTSTEETESAKGIKSSIDIIISGGTLDIDSSDDAIHSNNSVTISGDRIDIASGDDGIHADSSILIKNGIINISKSYEGLESAVITILDGKINVTSNDDGINVAGGNDSSAINGRVGQNNINVTENNMLNINGGYVVVDSTGDGLDANGSILITGGTVIVNGPTANNNGALDYDSTFEMSGGLLIAVGSSGMVQAPSEEATQYSIIMNYSQIQQAGTNFSLLDSNGNTILTYVPRKDYQSIVISSPELKRDTLYTIYSGGTSTGNLNDGLYEAGELKDGTKVVDFTISNLVTWLSESGETTSRSFNQRTPNGQGFDKNRPRPDKIRP